jgi:hypothetical protein
MSDWKKSLEEFFQEHEAEEQRKQQRQIEVRSEAEQFIKSTVIPAFKEIKTELGKYGREVVIQTYATWAKIEVTFEGQIELTYAIKTNGRPHPETTYAEEGRLHTSEGYFHSRAQDYTITEEEIIKHCKAEVERQAQKYSLLQASSTKYQEERLLSSGRTSPCC